jgi:amino acid transporter
MNDPVGVGGVPSTAVGVHQGGLERSVGFIGHIALVLSDITPTASLLVIGPVVILTAGTGSVLAYVLGGVIAVCVALCMGELGSMYPTAGGLYSIVTNVLGREVGFLAMLDYMGQAIFLPASVAFGVGTYVTSLNPNIPTNLTAGGIMALVTILALFQIRFNAILTGIFLLIELLVVTALTISGLAHLHQPLSILTHGLVASGTGLAPVTASIVVAAIAVALFSVNGYDSAINFSEETTGGAARVGRAVVTAALIGIVFEVIPFIAVVFGAPNLSNFLHSTTPLTDVARDSFGSTFVTIIIWGGILAIFNASLAITLQFARIVWAAGRDRAWPEPVSSWLGKVSVTRKSPWVATLVVGGLATILCLQSSLVTVVTFTAVLLIILYALIAISALVSRIRQPRLERPSRMPLWPVPPIIALVGSGLALTQQKGSDLLVVLGIIVAGVIYYYAFLRTRRDRYWTHEAQPEPQAAPES